MARFDVVVIPGGKRSGPYGWHGGLPKLRVLAPPAEGRAKSSRKTFEVDLSQDEIGQRLRRAFGEGN